MDQIDKRILQVLQDEGRIPVIELAERVGLSPTPCARRVSKLESDGLIRGYGAQLDQTKLGLPLTVFVFVELEGHATGTLAAFETAIRRFDEVVECHLMTGTRDVLLKVLAKDLAGFDQFLERHLLQVPGIRATRTSFSLRPMVVRNGPPVL